MISYSYSFVHRCKCKYCFSPPVKYKSYKKYPFEKSFVIQNSKYLDFSSLLLMEDILKFRKFDNVKIVYFNMTVYDHKSTIVGFKKNKQYIKKKQFTHGYKFASCKCGMSTWVDLSIDDPECLPESKITSNLKFNLKLNKSHGKK